MTDCLDALLARAAKIVQPWLATVLVIQTVGWWIYTQQAPIDTFSAPVYAISLVTSLAFWYLLNLGRDALGLLGRGLFAAVVALAVALLLVGSYQCYVEFGEFFSASMFEYAGRGGTGTFLRYIEEYLVYPLNLIFALVLGVVFAGWFFAGEAAADGPTERTESALLAALVFVLGLAGTSVLADGRHLSPDLAVMTAGIRSYFVPNDTGLHQPDREPLPERPERSGNPPPNILLIVNESLGTHELKLDGSRTDQMPRLQRRIRRHPDAYVAFDRAYTNSTSTDVSLPSLLTGLGPDEPLEHLHTVPLAWDWARAAGLQPFYLSAQNYSSTSFEEFFFADDPMPVFTPTSFPGRAGEDYRTDEIAVAEQFDEHLEQVPDDRRFFAVYNSNAMHKPFQTTSPLLKSRPEGPTDYRRAMRLLDRALDRIFRAIERDGRLEETVVIMTSDHGEYTTRKHRLPRILSLYEEFVRVPMLVRVPEPVASDAIDLSELKTNRRRNVANTDIVPSIIDLVDYEHDPATRNLVDQLSGHSLLEPVPRDRTVIAMNNNPIRHWEHEGFGVFFRDWRFIYTDVEGPQLFDLEHDPLQRDDRWSRAPESVRSRILETIRGNPHLSEIWHPD